METVQPWRWFGGHSAKLAPRRYCVAMPTIQVKNVPAEVHVALHRRAAAAGQSLQEFVLGCLCDEALTPTVDEVLDRVSHRSGGNVGLKTAARIVRAERDSH